MHETRAHLAKEAIVAASALRSTVEDLRRKSLASSAELDALVLASEAVCTKVQEHSVSRLDDWITNAGISIVEAGDHVQVEDLIELYVAGGAPFNVQGKKKSEFPDAIALLALDDWAETHGARVLSVSADDDWKRFGESSSVVHVIDDLAVALAAFQTPNAASVCRALFMSVDDGDPYGLQEALLNALDKDRDRIRLSLELDDTPYAERVDEVSITFKSVELPDFDHGADDFKPISHDSAASMTVIEITGWATAVISWRLSLAATDKVRAQRVIVGGGTYQDEQQFEFKALVTLSGGLGDWKITRSEIEPTIVESYLYEIAPQWYGEA